MSGVVGMTFSTSMNLANGLETYREVNNIPWRCAEVTILNESNDTLVLVDKKAHWGGWDSGRMPPEEIAPHSSATFLQANMMTLQPSEGDIRYRVKGTDSTFQLWWEIPACLSNKYEERPSQPMLLVRKGDGKGSHAEITWVYAGKFTVFCVLIWPGTDRRKVWPIRNFLRIRRNSSWPWLLLDPVM
jgi:hypothetical protein